MRRKASGLEAVPARAFWPGRRVRTLQVVLAAVSIVLVVVAMTRSSGAGNSQVDIGRAISIDGPSAIDDPPFASVVMVVSGRCGEPTAGTGFMLGDQSVVTAAHVAGPGDSMQIQGDASFASATAVADPGLADVAYARPDHPVSESGLRLAGGDPALDTEVVLLGVERSGRVAATPARITARGSAADYGLSGTELLVVDAQVPPGHSGGPVVDGSGAVVGVIAAGESRTETTLVTPVSELRLLLGTEDTSITSRAC